MLLIRRLMRVLQNFGLTLVSPVHALFETKQLTSYTRTAITIPITCLQVSDGEVIPVSRGARITYQIHDIPGGAVLNRLEIQPMLWCIFLILLPGNVVKSGLHSYLFFRILRIVFFLTKLVFIMTLTCFLQKLHQPSSA